MPSLSRTLFILTILSLVAAISFMFSLTQGSADVGFNDLIQLLEFSQHQDTLPLSQQIILQIRLPRSINAFWVGGLLGLAGVLMQILLKNPLAEPYILGVSGGASVAALGIIILGMSSLLIPIAAFFGAIISTLLVFFLSGGIRQRSAEFLLLTGIVIAAGWGAIINLLLSFSSQTEMQSMIFWLLGDLSAQDTANWLKLSLPLFLLISLLFSRQLNMLMYGDQSATTLGVNVGRLRILLYLLSAACTAIAVSIAGSIGFIGLIVPHLMRLLIGSDHRLLLPASVLFGGSLLCLADTLSRSLFAPQIIPVGVITALLGVPLFLFLLHQNRRWL